MRSLLVGAVLAVCPLMACLAQRPPNPAAAEAAAQHDAMAKLKFLEGKWVGPANIVRGPGEPLHLTQTEEIHFKLDGLLLLIEGTSRDAAGKPMFQALATVSYDEATSTYRFRAYNGGHYVDAPLTVVANGFSWGYDAGPVTIHNTMHLTDKGEWSEETVAVMGTNPPRPSVSLLLTHQP